jgi:RNA polymerase subunit RPABC4/transcription elongation factor Spt4
MRRAGEPPNFDVGPLVRVVRDPETLVEANVTASLRVETTVVDTVKLVQAQHTARDFATFDAGLGKMAADSVFAELVIFARQTSASLADATGAALRPKLEAALVARLGRDLADLGLGVAKLESVTVALDPATEAWMRARRASSRPPPAPPVIANPDESTEIAAICRDCGAQVASMSSACPRCGGAAGAATACGRCGTVARPESRFCVACGTPISRG